MKTPLVIETRRAGQRDPLARHRRQVALVARSVVAVPDQRRAWDERTRTA